MYATIIQPPAREQTERIPLARQALADCPEYLAHICRSFSRCGDHLRAGQDEIGLNAFARGATDLQQFVQLLQHVKEVARPAPGIALSAFEQNLVECVRGIELSMYRQDLVCVSDEIEGRLVPLLYRWAPVAAELHSGLDQQAA